MLLSPGLYVTLWSPFPLLSETQESMCRQTTWLSQKPGKMAVVSDVSNWKLCFAFEICPIEWKHCWCALPKLVWHRLFLVPGGEGPSFKRGLGHRRLTWCLLTATVAEDGIETCCLITRLSRLRILQKSMFSHKWYRWNITSMSFLLSFWWDLCCGTFLINASFRFYCHCPSFTTASSLVGNTTSKPSRVPGNSASLIDNIFVSNPDCVSASGNIISDVSDHFSQFCIFRSARDRIKPVKRKMRDFTNFDRDSFTQDLNQIDWQSIIANGNNDIDYIFSSFYSK